MDLSDKEYCQLTISIGKAVSMLENPVKEKHVRAAIIGTYHSRGGSSFWSVMLKQPLLENRIVAWKFCHVLHKVLREGHYMCIPQSMRHKDILVNVGKLWGHLREGYGKLIQLYSTLMLTKLDFHNRNPHIPGNLMMSMEELEKIYGNDINNYFQLSVEMFDYMDDILTLQEAIFGSLDACRSNSMTSSGQCRLAPLIPCIQDSNQLYDFSVKLLFRLHSALHPDTLIGHRDRFMKQFSSLKSFYTNTNQMQYFINLIQIPKLPERPPNFLEQSDLRSYVPPVVVLAEPVQEPEVEQQVREEALLDVSVEPRNELHDLISERDALINHLQGEIARLKGQITHLISEARNRSEAAQAQLEAYQARVLHLEEELEREREARKQLEALLSVQPAEGKVEELEKKSQAQEEKFQRLKELYTKTRDEHVKLLRQKAEVDKILSTTIKEKTQLEESQKEVETKTQQGNAEMHAKLNDLQIKYEENQNTLQDSQRTIQLLEERNSEILETKNELERNISELEKQNENLAEIRKQFEELQNEHRVLEENRKETSDLYNILVVNHDSTEESLRNIQNELQELKISHDSVVESRDALLQRFDELMDLYTVTRDEKLDLEKRGESLCREFEEKCSLHEARCLDLVGQVTILDNDVQNKSTELMELSVKYNELLKEVDELKNSHNEITNQNISQIKELKDQYEDVRKEKMTLVEKVDCLSCEKKIVESEVDDLVVQRDELDKRLKESLQICEQIKANAEREQTEHNTLITRLNASLMQSTADNVRRSLNELDEPAASGLACTPDYFQKTIEEACAGLEKLIVPNAVVQNNGTIFEEPCKNIMACAHLLCAVITQGKGTSNTSTNIELGERLQESVRVWGTTCAASLDSLAGSASSSGQGDVTRAESIEELLKSLRALGELASGIGVTDVGMDALSDQVEDELAGMDAAIEEAAKKIEGLLSASRTADKGIKLEVNERILDACTGLMASIRVLVQCSRSVQAEIVAEGKGTATAKEFYKRNHQWTEGLISAAKAVALGAKLLVSAADEAVKGKGKLEVLTVAAQEIAACSVQLVVASRVKAQRGSAGLLALRKASVGVGQTTGAVVAAVKSCAEMVETAQDLDMSGLNLHQAKKLEMESQVRLIELEQSLAMERLRLASLRRQHYQLAGECRERMSKFLKGGSL